MVNDSKNNTVHFSSIIVEGTRTVLVFYKRFFHKNETNNNSTRLKSIIKRHKLGETCPNKTADKKIFNNFLLKNKM